MAAIACIAVPRFLLVASCGQRRSAGKPLILVSGGGSGATVVEVSRLAEGLGVRRGMRLARAFGLSADLRVVLPDPVSAEDLWAGVVQELEGLGALVEADRPGEAFFDVNGLRGLYGGSISGVLERARDALPLEVRSAVAPSRFASFVAAVMDRRRSPLLRDPERVIGKRELAAFLAPLPTAALLVGPGLEEKVAADLVETLEQLGIETLGGLADLPRADVADRFGGLGLFAQDLALGEDDKLRPREPGEELHEDLDLPDGATAGVQLERGLELLVGRLLDRPERKGRTVLATRLAARLDSGGSWTETQELGQPTSSAKTISSLLLPRLGGLPSPPVSLSLRATALGPAAAEQLRLPDTGRAGDADRLNEKIGQLRALQGPDVVLGVVDVDAGSRVPERWAALAPYAPRR